VCSSSGFGLFFQHRNALAQYAYGIVEMTDCILEVMLDAIHSFRHASIIGLTGRLCPSISRRLGHGSLGLWIELSARATMAVSAISWITEAALVMMITSLASKCRFAHLVVVIPSDRAGPGRF
jgi:hypothetical protein